jgi:hypothetical protein
MKQYVRCRDYEEGDSFPFEKLNGIGGFYPCSPVLYEHWLPEAIEDDEFAMVIDLEGELVKVIATHFDFVEET